MPLTNKQQLEVKSAFEKSYFQLPLQEREPAQWQSTRKNLVKQYAAENQAEEKQFSREIIDIFKSMLEEEQLFQDYAKYFPAEITQDQSNILRLAKACFSENTEMLEAVSAETKMDLNAQGIYPCDLRPLHFAVAAGKLDAVKKLIELKADPCVFDERNETPVHFAATDPSKFPILQYLLDIPGALNKIEAACAEQKLPTPLETAVRISETTNRNNIQLLIIAGSSLTQLISRDGKLVTSNSHARHSSVSKLVAGMHNGTFHRLITPPVQGSDAIFSRRFHAEALVGGDAIVFPLECSSTTSYSFVQAIRSTQEKIYRIAKDDFDFEEENKDHAAFMLQENLHCAFSSTLPISREKEYTERKAKQTSGQLAQASQALQDFLNQDLPVTGEIRECIMKEDGHLVVRIDIKPASALIAIKEKMKEIFGETYVRHPEHEEKQTLTCVIAVVDYLELSEESRTLINAQLSDLCTKLKEIGPIHFLQAEWIHYSVRSLASRYRHSEKVFQCVDTAKVHPATFRGGKFFAPVPARHKDIDINNIHPALLPQLNLVR